MSGNPNAIAIMPRIEETDENGNTKVIYSETHAYTEGTHDEIQQQINNDMNQFYQNAEAAQQATGQ